MEAIARQMAADQKIVEGIVCGFSQLETCRTFRFEYVKDLPGLRGDYRVCSVLYVFVMHRVLGLIHVKIETWFPLTMQVYVNGHDYLAKKLSESGVKFAMHDNAFTWIEDPAQAQKLAAGFARKNWPHLLGQLARQFNPLMGRELGDRDYYWVANQAEFATDVMFEEASGLSGLYRRLVEHARACVSADDVLRFLGRKPSGNFLGEVQSHVSRRVEGVRVVHRMNSNKLKMYDKGGIVLRIETTINDPQRVSASASEARRQREADVATVARGVAWMWRYADVSQAANRRYLLRRWRSWTTTAAARQLLDRATKLRAEAAGR